MTLALFVSVETEQSFQMNAKIVVDIYGEHQGFGDSVGTLVKVRDMVWLPPFSDEVSATARFNLAGKQFSAFKTAVVWDDQGGLYEIHWRCLTKLLPAEAQKLFKASIESGEWKQF